MRLIQGDIARLATQVRFPRPIKVGAGKECLQVLMHPNCNIGVHQAIVAMDDESQL
eukprot:CAMPEP_0177267976 /NCGR_PEP_ID=MMETSP0367-20130122/63555_1 /TAXON_ID=447022 ORGANISM="Scrippsiella hangoei-like, Strain SHHI-4" /NCGR_SAMPLE_ID=MMETSP0367 /ASSEMBLY_ACC=CAM_ASM_000362 /LENGTH=55 /DNA_ID=CAMNT_0018723549 /DNA_START=88 /DNA_END=255 /DNA_ORIENTATION=+